MSDDRLLMAARDEILTYLGELCDVGYDDIPELVVKVSGIREVCDRLIERAYRIANERADKEAREERETAIPPLAS